MKYCLFSCFLLFLFLFAGVLTTYSQERGLPQSGTWQEAPVPKKPAGIPITEVTDRAQDILLSDLVLPDYLHSRC